MKLQQKLNNIQQKLVAPKNQTNNFGHYNYRSAEDIMEAVKPLLDGCILLIEDEMVNVGERYYIKATVTIKDENESISTTAFAREAENKKGMDDSQITGATSSYARKYALNGIFAIDDTKDADRMDNTQPQQSVSDTLIEVTNSSDAVQKLANYKKGNDDDKKWVTDETFADAIKKSFDAGIIKIGTPVNQVMAILRKKYKVAKKYNELVEAEINKQITDDIDVNQIPI